jgi:dCTP deaminase
MPFWDDNRWRTTAGALKVVTPFDSDVVEDANYLLSIGDEVYVSDEDSKKTSQRLAEGESFAIEPGQFAFLLTEETVKLPFNVIGFISIRASIKFSGLVNISGFHVDPGYQGKLLFSVFNAGPARIHLKRGERIFPIWLADLHADISKKVVKKGFHDIPSKYINQISGKFTTAYQLEKQIDALKEDIAGLKAFKLQAFVILTIMAALLLPTIRDIVVKLSQETPVVTHSDVGVAPPNAPTSPTQSPTLKPAPPR